MLVKRTSKGDTVNQQEIENRIEQIAKDLALTAQAYSGEITPGAKANIKVSQFDLQDLLEDIRNS